MAATDSASTSAPAQRGEGRAMALCALLVFAGFTLTSTSYLAWLYHLMGFVEPAAADGLTMVGGYALQAAGIGVVTLAGRRRPDTYGRMPFLVIVTLHFACAVPATMSTTLAGTLAFGYLMNALCGMIAAFYLHRLATAVPKNRRGTVFGGGYACSILVSWLLSIVPPFGEQGTLGPLVPCLALSVLAAIIVFAPAQNPQSTQDQGKSGNAQSDTASTAPAPLREHENDSKDTLRTVVAFAAFAVLLMSLVKNVGFNFPSADIAAGIDLELSRLFYAVGLVIAGIVIDRSRKYGAICCLAALITPFAQMALAGEPIPGMALWALDYFFYGFFSVFRVVLFADIAEEDARPHLSGFGLMIGRIGDALGTAVCLSLASSSIALVTVAAVLFITTVFVFYRLSQLLFQPHPVQPKSEEELFEEFCQRHDVSAREREVLRLVQAERSNSEIAAELFVSESTVKFHMRNLLKKTGCKNRQELRAALIEELR